MQNRECLTFWSKQYAKPIQSHEIFTHITRSTCGSYGMKKLINMHQKWGQFLKEIIVSFQNTPDWLRPWPFFQAKGLHFSDFFLLLVLSPYLLRSLNYAASVACEGPVATQFSFSLSDKYFSPDSINFKTIYG